MAGLCVVTRAFLEFYYGDREFRVLRVCSFGVNVVVMVSAAGARISDSVHVVEFVSLLDGAKMFHFVLLLLLAFFHDLSYNGIVVEANVEELVFQVLGDFAWFGDFGLYRGRVRGQV